MYIDMYISVYTYMYIYIWSTSAFPLQVVHVSMQDVPPTARGDIDRANPRHEQTSIGNDMKTIGQP